MGRVMVPRIAGFRSVFQRLLEAVVIALMVGLAGLVVIAVAFRQAGSPLVWYDEVASVLLAWLTYYGAALAAFRRGHIGFPEIVRRLSPARQRTALLIREAVVIGFMGVAAWAGWQVVRVVAGTSLVSLPWVSTQVTQSVIPIGAVLFIIAEVTSIPTAWSRAASRAGEVKSR
jgi:TRAP-type C4-dicarboxylate transport system permease small subunit